MLTYSSVEPGCPPAPASAHMSTTTPPPDRTRPQEPLRADGDAARAPARPQRRRVVRFAAWVSLWLFALDPAGRGARVLGTRPHRARRVRRRDRCGRTQRRGRAHASARAPAAPLRRADHAPCGHSQHAGRAVRARHLVRRADLGQAGLPDRAAARRRVPVRDRPRPAGAVEGAAQRTAAIGADRCVAASDRRRPAPGAGRHGNRAPRPGRHWFRRARGARRSRTRRARRPAHRHARPAPVEPGITTAEAERARDRVARIMSAPISVRRGKGRRLRSNADRSHRC